MIDVQVGNRRERLSTGTRDRHLAEKKEQNIIDALRDDPDVTSLELKRILRGERLAALQERRHEQRSWTLKEACDACLKDRGDGGWGEAASNDTYATNCRMIQAYLDADTPVAFIDQEKVTDLADYLLNDEENAQATVNRKLFALMHVLAYAKAHKQYPNDLPKWKPHREGDNARQFVLTASDERELFAAIAKLDERPDNPEGGNPVSRDAADYVDYFTFLADIGCRSSQALKVRWRDIDWELMPGVVGVKFWRKGEQKGGRVRTIPCNDRVLQILKRRRPLKGDGPFSGLRRQRGNALWTMAKATTELANESECVPHCLRHTCATRLLARTGDLKLVQEWLGHTKIETTASIYAKVLVDTKVRALSALQDGWNGASPIPDTGTIQDCNISHIGEIQALTH
ncbi:tyrosine-type recombinase/integrase [Xanthomonas campestris]|uniref:tyrosine-type recombinase/integrase n=1 Tax=Xanthomonas campestris TaxID=339 RepID=UPI002B22C501|nr:site-specific integrase [Xanthomonas campestris]MEA9660701.1 site-specific integrase [Xanthomonas campestris pv. raphani]MEA9757469.1 site-specific integrase [Xanthomonas campestris pv. raphani]MEA9765659.1 site-specific integrase [Xanthomonas campestris pv. raphani]MEA9817874.1 site-specific integrase [Xanthomonas campestris pv. raphani]MEA9911119.1 site-specific integrase [Xanthomonas campestris pv. raphani]